MTNDGKPYGPLRYRQIVNEAYVLTKNTHTTYSDVMQMTPLERSYMLDFLKDEATRAQELINKANQKKTLT